MDVVEGRRRKRVRERAAVRCHDVVVEKRPRV